ncbi:hypothetical protein [Enterococcus casseliflavus]|uniref:hypothetical protein n=1 Tax=Enterococcus TaxID=1350 RepID=UPI0022E836DF|nr:hypothetical protein [Enterococcus casseliflavus]MEB6085497.1 hypothetical protein [Enterococcus casseliflavus]
MVKCGFLAFAYLVVFEQWESFGRLSIRYTKSSASSIGLNGGITDSGFPPDDFSKNDFAPSDLLRQEQQ